MKLCYECSLLRGRAILLVFEKIYSCLLIPNCTQNHVITYTNVAQYTVGMHNAMTRTVLQTNSPGDVSLGEEKAPSLQ